MNKLLLLSAWILPVLSAGAASPEEDAVNQMLMPHTKLAGPTVTVHHARTQGYLEGEPNNRAQLAKMRSDVAACVAGHQKMGKPVNPPKVYPDYVNSLRFDTYVGINRSIVYSSAVAHAIDWKDCSLHANRETTAALVSSLGVCEVNSKLKTAQGQCDRKGHADAPMPVDDAIAKAIEAGMPPAMIEGMKKAASTPNQPRRVKKPILGLTCEIHALPMHAGTQCLATGGKAFTLAGHAHGLSLESRSDSGVVMNAVEARLDERIPATIFTPYLAPGFVLNRPEVR